MPPSRQQTELQRGILLELQQGNAQTRAMLGEVLSALRGIEQEIHLLRKTQDGQACSEAAGDLAGQ